jgi:hypothetical protein
MTGKTTIDEAFALARDLDASTTQLRLTGDGGRVLAIAVFVLGEQAGELAAFLDSAEDDEEDGDGCETSSL